MQNIEYLESDVVVYKMALYVKKSIVFWIFLCYNQTYNVEI